MALKERVLAGGRLRILIYVASQLVAWCMALLTIRFLKPEDYGVMAVGAVVIAAGTVIAALGLPIYMVQTPRIRRDLLRRIAGVLVISFVTMAALVAIAAPFAADFLEMPALELVLFILSACLVVRAFSIAPSAWLQRVIKFREVAVLESSAMIASAGLGLALAIEGYGALALAGKEVAAVTISAGLGMWMTRGRLFPEFRLAGLREPLRFGFRVTVRNMLQIIQINTDRLIIARMFGAEALGIYSLGTAIGRIVPRLVMTPISRIVLPALSRLGALDPRRATYFMRGTGLLAFVFFPAAGAVHWLRLRLSLWHSGRPG